MLKDRRHTCSRDVHLVIHYTGVFTLVALVCAVSLIAYSLAVGKSVDNTLLVALLVQPMTAGIGHLNNLVTQSKETGGDVQVVKTEVSGPNGQPVPITDKSE